MPVPPSEGPQAAPYPSPPLGSVPEELHLLMAVEGTGPRSLLPPFLWLSFPSFVLLCSGAVETAKTQRAQTSLGSSGDIQTYFHGPG